MKTYKKKLLGFLIAVCTLCLTAGAGNIQNVQAASKATYTIKKIQEKKTYKGSSALYSYELPQLKGNSAAVRKINQSLKSSYTKDLSLKKSLFKQFNDYKKNGTLNKKRITLYASTKCTSEYNKNGYISFTYRFAWHRCRSYDSNKETVIYRLKDGKKVSSIPATAMEKQALNLLRGTWCTADGDLVTFSGKEVSYYFSASLAGEPFWVFTIDEITKTNYGYYFKIDMGYNCYFGYQLRLKDKNTLVRIGNGKPYSSAGYSKANSLTRKNKSHTA